MSVLYKRTFRTKIPLPIGDCVVIWKNRLFEKGERRSGGKDLGRQPLAVRIQACQAYENIRFYTSDNFP